MNNELTAALLTIEKCRELSGCPAGVDLQDWVKKLAAETVRLAAENKMAVDAVTVFSNVTHDVTEIICDELGHDRVAEIVAAYNDLGNMPATDRIVAVIKATAQSEVIEWLDAEITALDTMYRGDPSYERDAYWMKSEVLDVVELARKAFTAQLHEGADK